MTQFFTLLGIFVVMLAGFLVTIPILVVSAQFWRGVYEDIRQRRKKDS